ncbi:RNA recognition motif containing protein [Ditylenchus destructor]|nr:RNA recognition motif containing protein [Ditylenchus destructor]
MAPLKQTARKVPGGFAPKQFVAKRQLAMKVKQEPKVKLELKRKAEESPKKVEQSAAKQARVGDPKSISARPVDPLQIVLSGIPKGTSIEQLQVLFPNAEKITLEAELKSLTWTAFIKFDDEKHAKEAFDKGASLKVNSSPVDVHFARVLIPKAELKAETAVKNPEAPKKQEKKPEQPKKKTVELEVEESSEDDDDEELDDDEDDFDLDSSEESIDDDDD